MKEQLLDLRQGFYDWLVKQGLSEKTKAGRPGTTYEYVTRLDRLSQKIFNKIDWFLLGRDIDILCVVHKMYALKKHWKFPVSQTFDLIERYFKWGDLPFKKSRLLHLNKYVKQLKGHMLEIKNTQTALLNFYKYLEKLSESDEIRQLKNISHDKISQRMTREIAKIETACKHEYLGVYAILQMTTYDQSGNPYKQKAKVLPATPTAAKRIKDYTPKSYLADPDIAKLLEVSDSTLQRLKERKKRGFTLNTDTSTARIINRYMSKHHHPCFEGDFIGQKSSEPEEWYSASVAADKLGYSMSYLKKLRREGKIAYTQNSPRNFRYSPQDIARLNAEKEKRNKNS